MQLIECMLRMEELVRLARGIKTSVPEPQEELAASKAEALPSPEEICTSTRVHGQPRQSTALSGSRSLG